VDEGRREAEELRQELARIDAQLIAALHRRARTSKALGHLRGDHGPSLPMSDQASIRATVAQTKGDMPEDAVRDIFREIYAACIALELPARVVFVGPEGGPGYAAVRGRFGRGPSLFAIDSTSAALDEVTRKRAQLAVVPFETTTEGPVQGTLLALLASDLRIAEVIEGKFDLHLMKRSGTAETLERVYATPGDHARCQRFLTSLGVPVIDVATPLLACRSAAEEPASAALASEAFGGELGLEVAHRNVLDTGEERVRYAVVATRPSGRTGSDRTSLVFGAQDGPGSLLDVLRVFAERGVNLTNIHSHPVDGDAWRYLFYVEMTGHFTDRPLVTAFEEMKRMTRFFKVLGSYPAP
jgi:chorismate mutase/prephenate dehydratase